MCRAAGFPGLETARKIALEVNRANGFSNLKAVLEGNRASHFQNTKGASKKAWEALAGFLDTRVPRRVETSPGSVPRKRASWSQDGSKK